MTERISGEVDEAKRPRRKASLRQERLIPMCQEKQHDVDQPLTPVGWLLKAVGLWR